ncbi:hypothetical protein E4T50_16417 [Aureobasidium sp. EXF-12298]|nr:hypothetical protein E4T50_16417 [Aureobasidium sp. EXF-12298]
MSTASSLYAYNPSHVAPIIFSVIFTASLILHTYQNFKYNSWRITFFLVWGNLFFTTGWILRSISSFNPHSSTLYTAQYRFIITTAPIYAAAEYNILGRLLRYLPMQIPLHPDRVVYVFIVLGVVVEALLGTGASLVSTARVDHHGKYKTGRILLAVAFLLQAFVEIAIFCFVVVIHWRCIKSGTFPRNAQRLCILLYGTSILVFLLCLCRIIEAFGLYRFYDTGTCRSLCATLAFQECYLYVFEAAPMVLYTFWLNLVHPGTLLPRKQNMYLDMYGKTDRMGPGWIDRRSRWESLVDPFDVKGRLKGTPAHEKFWLQPQRWPRVEDPRQSSWHRV